MSKTIFIIPGFKTQISDPLYKKLTWYLKSTGYTVKAVPIAWSNRTLTENSQEFVSFFNEKKGKINYVIGFSYGAVIALMTAHTTEPEKLILCSLSPDFKEDIDQIADQQKKYIGKRRYADIATRSARELAQTLTAKTILLYGEKEGLEYPQLKQRSEGVAKLAKNSKLIVVKNAPHDISFAEYQEALEEIL